MSTPPQSQAPRGAKASFPAPLREAPATVPALVAVALLIVWATSQAGYPRHPLGARRADRAGAARDHVGRGRAATCGRMPLPVKIAVGLPGGLHGAQLPLDPVGRGAGRRLGRGQPDAAVPARVRAVRLLAPAGAQRGAAAGGVGAGDDRPGGVRGAARGRRRAQSAPAGACSPAGASSTRRLRQRQRGPVADGILAGAAAGAQRAAALGAARPACRRRGAAGRGRAAEPEPRLAVCDAGDARARVRAAARAGAHVRAARAGRGRASPRPRRRCCACGDHLEERPSCRRRRCTAPPRRRSLAALVVGLVVALGAAIEQRRSFSASAAGRMRRGVGARRDRWRWWRSSPAGWWPRATRSTRLEHGWDTFKGGYGANSTSGSRLISGLGSNRYDFYRVALDEFLAHPLARDRRRQLPAAVPRPRPQRRDAPLSAQRRAAHARRRRAWSARCSRWSASARRCWRRARGAARARPARRAVVARRRWRASPTGSSTARSTGSGSSPGWARPRSRCSAWPARSRRDTPAAPDPRAGAAAAVGRTSRRRTRGGPCRRRSPPARRSALGALLAVLAAALARRRPGSASWRCRAPRAIWTHAPQTAYARLQRGGEAEPAQRRSLSRGRAASRCASANWRAPTTSSRWRSGARPATPTRRSSAGRSPRARGERAEALRAARAGRAAEPPRTADPPGAAAGARGPARERRRN